MQDYSQLFLHYIDFVLCETHNTTLYIAKTLDMCRMTGTFVCVHVLQIVSFITCHMLHTYIQYCKAVIIPTHVIGLPVSISKCS